MYTNETEQMMAQGGLKEQGGTTDAVSGNDVPPGALQEEVRDDISAKLSGGEFVFPADVVRYIGLKNIMKLRDEAKMGLQKMEEIGQMGNSKSGSEGEALHGAPEENDEEFSSSIDEIMNSGEDEGEEKKYAPGGYVPAENKALYANAPIKGFEMIPMENDSGNVIYIPFIDGKPQLNIPEGYNIKAKVTTTPTATVGEAAKTGAAAGDRAGGGMGSDATGERAGAWGRMSAEERAAEMDAHPTIAALDARLQGLVPSGLLAMQQSLNTPGTSARDLAARKGTAALAAFDAQASSEQSTRNALADEMRAAEHATAKTAINNAIANNTDPEAELGKLAEGMGITTGGLTGTTVGTTGGGFQSSFGSGSVGGTGGGLGISTDTGPGPGAGVSVGPSGPSIDTGNTVGLGSKSDTGGFQGSFGSGSVGGPSTATDTGGFQGSFGSGSAGGTGGGLGLGSKGGVTDSSGAAVSDSSGAQVGTTDFGDKGGGGGGGGGGCFLTTAAVDHMNEKDDGEVLSTLREFRDTYMKKNKEKSKDVAWYYDNAPKIVKAIDARQDAKSLYTKMYNRYIKKAYRQIKNGDLEEAYTTYKAGIDFAKKSANIKKGFLGARSSVKDSEVKKVKSGFVPR